LQLNLNEKWDIVDEYSALLSFWKKHLSTESLKNNLKSRNRSGSATQRENRSKNKSIEHLNNKQKQNIISQMRL